MREIQIQEGEVWYPAVSEYGPEMPYDQKTKQEVQMTWNPTANQMQPLLLSSHGRILYHWEGYTATFDSGIIRVDEDAVLLVEGCKTLKEAYLYACARWFERERLQVRSELMEQPIYNTWMYAPFEVTEEKVLAYGAEIEAQHLPIGTLIIDDKWSLSYGDWRFDHEKFPNPEAMIAFLHEKGFFVMLWVCPYVSFGTEAFETCKEQELLLKEGEEISALTWWNETSACLDLRKEEALDYMRASLQSLMELGVDGFKFDGGDSRFYTKEQEPDLQSHQWALLASEYAFNELRAEYHGSGLSLFERLSDKRNSWGPDGIGGILPSALALGLSGHPFFAPDMIGGGEVKDLLDGKHVEKELFFAHCQLAMLFPGIQFSLLPGAVLGSDLSVLQAQWETRKQYLPYLRDEIAKSRVTKEPLIRLMEYEFPGEGMEYVTDQFMLGERYLVIPMTKKKQKHLEVCLPGGRWKYQDRILKGGRVVKIPAAWDRIAVLERMNC